MNLIRIAPNGAKLFEIPPPKEAQHIGAYYKVIGPNSPEELYFDQNKLDAEKAFEEAAAQ